MRRAGAALIVTAMLGIGAGCGGSSAPAAAPSGCQQIVHDVPGRVVPETSGFTCVEIRESINALPPESGGFGFEGGVLRGLWSCHRYVPAENGVLLRCKQDQKRFSIVKR